MGLWRTIFSLQLQLIAVKPPRASRVESALVKNRNYLSDCHGEDIPSSLVMGRSVRPHLTGSQDTFWIKAVSNISLWFPKH